MPDIWDHYKVLKSDFEYVSKELRSARISLEINRDK